MPIPWFKKELGTVVQNTLRAVPATIPDPFLNLGRAADSTPRNLDTIQT